MPITVHIADKSTGAPATYFYTFNNGETSSAKQPSITYTIPGVYIIKQVITDGASQKDSTTVTVNVYGTTSDFSYNYTNICTTPATINFTASEAATDVKYRWEFGDGNKSINRQTNNVYTANGKYDVQLTTVSLQGCQSVTTKHIQIGKGDADFAVPATVCANQPVHFTNTSLPLPATTTWSINNTTITGTDAQYIFTQTGNYTITMKASFGTCTNSVTKQITVWQTPKTSFTQSGTLVSCAFPQTISFTNSSVNGASYKWVFGDGQTSTETSPQHTYTTAGMFTVSLITFNPNGCSDTLTKNELVKLGPPVITGFNNLPNSGCVPVTIKPTANIISPEPIVSYNWDFGDGSNHSVQAAPVHQYNVAGYFKITLVVTTASGCTGTYSLSQGAAAGAFPPVVDFVVDNANVCASTPQQFTATAVGTVTSWNWEFGDGTKSNIQNPIHTYADLGNYTVTLYVSDKGCPSNNQKKNFILVKPPIAKLEPKYFCDDRLRVDFVDKSIQPKTWSWDFGDGQISTNQNETHNYAQSGQYHVTLTTTNDGCTSVADTIVTVINQKPTVTMQPANGIVCKNDSLTIITANTTYALDRLWNLGDGTTLFGDDEIKHAYKQPGTYQPSLIVIYTNGCNDTLETQKTIVYGPQAAFTNPAKDCLGSVTAFTDNSTTDGIHAIKTWLWTAGDGTTTSQTQPVFTHAYNATGTYVPSLKVTDSYGCSDTLKSNLPISVNGALAAFNFENKSVTCDSALYIFTNKTAVQSDPVIYYAWSFGDGDSAFVQDTQHYFSHSNPQNNVSLTIKTQAGCSNTVTQNVILNVPQKTGISTVIPSQACVLTQTNFTATPQNQTNPIVSWKWDFGNGATSDLQSPTYTFKDAGDYKITLMATNASGCADTAIQNIKLDALPLVDAGNDTLICAGTRILLHATGADNFMWKSDASISCINCSTPLATPVSTTKYYVTGTDKSGCAATDSLLVNVKLKPVFSVSNSTAICIGDSTMLTTSGGYDSYTWEPATGLSYLTNTSLIAKPNLTTNYTVKATDNIGCFIDTRQVTITVFPLPEFDINDTVLVIGRSNQQQLLTTSSPDVVRWQWLPSQGLSCYNCASPFVTGSENVSYTANAYTSAGCKATDNVRVEILCDNKSLYMPSAFTPNHDGKNDRFFPLTLGAQKIKSFVIYNRNGQMIFSKQNILSNNYNDGWDGRFKSYDLPQEVFIYRVEMICNGLVIPVSGTVTLIR